MRKGLGISTILVFPTLSNWVIAGLGFVIRQLLETFQIDLNSISQGLLGSCIMTLSIGIFMLSRKSLTDPWTELLLGSHSPLFWKTAGVHLLVASFLWRDNLEC